MSSPLSREEPLLKRKSDWRLHPSQPGTSKTLIFCVAVVVVVVAAVVVDVVAVIDAVVVVVGDVVVVVVVVVVGVGVIRS